MTLFKIIEYFLVLYDTSRNNSHGLFKNDSFPIKTISENGASTYRCNFVTRFQHSMFWVKSDVLRCIK